MNLYNLPGRLIAELWYLWPKKGQVWGSGRRRAHPFVHFLYSTVFYILLGVFIVIPTLSFLINQYTNPDNSYSAFNLSSPSDSHEVLDGNVELPIVNSEQVSSDASRSENAEIETNDGATSDELAAERFNKQRDDAEAEISSYDSAAFDKSDALRKAKISAAESGETVRWEYEGQEGYAIPSSPDAISGCRNVYYSIDSQKGWKSDTELICPNP